MSRGRLCARGWTAHQTPVWGERLTTPMIRRAGVLTAVSWREALDHAAGRLSELRASGTVGVLGSPRATNEDNYLAVKLARVALKTPHLDSCQGSAGGLLLEGIADVTHVPPLASFADVEAADLVLLVEGDLVRSHPRAAFAVMTAIRRGATLVTIGPRVTHLARLGAVHMTAAPGRLAAVVNGLLAAMMELAGARGASLAERYDGCDALLDELAADSGDACSVDIAKQIAAAERMVVILGAAAISASQARAQGAAWASLLALSGHLDRPGSGFVVAQSRANALGTLAMGMSPDRLPGWFPLDDRDALDRVEATWRADAELSEGAPSAALIRAVDGLIVLAEDPETSLPDGAAAHAALEAAECVIVLDAFVTETVKLAEVVLPIASFAESDGTYTSMTGRLRRLRSAAAPPGNARSAFAVLGEIGARLGSVNGHATPADVFGEIAAIAPAYAGKGYRAASDVGTSGAADARRNRRFRLRVSPPDPEPSPEWPWVLGIDGDHDWSRDPLIRYSPIASRDSVSRQKLFPSGWVEMSRDDAEELGVRAGRRVRLSSRHGEVVVPAQIRPEICRHVALVPFECREHAAAVLGGAPVAAVRVEPA